MIWKTAPVYPGVPLELGDRYYTPGTKDNGVIYSKDLIPDEDINRINKQTGDSDNANYLLRPYSQRNWKPKVGSNQKKSSTSTGKPRTSTSSITSRSRTATKAPASNLINPNQHTFNRRETKDFMRQNLLNPYDYSASERDAFRHSISNDTGDWSNASKIMSDARINKSLSKSIDTEKNQFLINPQLKLNLGYDPSQNNQLVNLKFKQGGQMYKYAAGAQMVQPQQTNSQDPIDQIAQIAAGSLQGDENSKQQLIQVLSNKEIAPKLLQIVDAGVKNQDKRAIIIAQAIKVFIVG